MKPKVLVVDDEKGLRYTFEAFLTDEGYDVVLAETLEEAFDKINKNKFDVIFTDILLGDKSGIELLRAVKEKDMQCPVIMITGFPNINTASEAVRLGAFDYISKPVKQEHILLSAGQALSHKRLIDEKERYKANLEAIFKSVKEGIVTVDKELNILEINEAAKRICSLSECSPGKSIEEAFTECDGKECIQALKNTISLKKPVKLTRLECVNKENPGQIVSLNISPLLRKGKVFSGAVMVIRDETELASITKKLREKGEFHNITGKSEKMQEIYSLLEKLADVPTTVLITGESGTGKELIAEALHYTGERQNKPLIKINCSALPENLLESELFGHVKGSFTGAIKNKTGWFEMAHKGTIFLDEIGDITHALQLRLLRVLQEREFIPVGASKPVKVDVRVITSTNQHILEKIEKGEFREDLYYRLKVFEVRVPPLRDRKEDIPILVEHFIKKYNKILKKDIKGISKNVMKIFLDYLWPGNIRELEHTIEHALILSNQFLITIDSLPEEFRNFSVSKSKKSYRLNDEGELIRDALEKCNWKKAKAARLLEIDRKTIYRKMKQYGIPLEKLK